MLILDTNVLVAALRSKQGASRQLLVNVLSGRISAGVSVPLFLEYESVLKRPEQLQAFSLRATEIDEFLSGLATMLKPIDISFLWRPQLKDPADEMVLEAAVNGRCSHLVTWNLRDFAQVSQRFNVVCCTPAEYISSAEPEPLH